MNKYKTEQRKILIDLFENSNHQAFSVAQIQKALSNKEVSLSAIYRNIAEMEKEGLLCKVNEKNSPCARYQYIDPEHCVGIIHFKCQTCDATFHLDKNISKMIMDVAEDAYSFSINGSSAFLYGQCAKCSQNAKSN